MSTEEALEAAEELGAVRDAHAANRVKRARYTSASQVDAWRLCPRRWWYREVEGLPEPRGKSADEGVDIDDNYVQPYLLTGEMRPGKWGALLVELAKVLPVPKPDNPRGLMVQERVTLPSYDGGPRFTGFPDFAEWVAPDWLEIGDLKTTSDFRYCKTPDELRAHVQPNVYSRWGYEVLGAETVSIYHAYGRRRGKPKAHRVPLASDPPLVLGRAENEANWAEIIKDVRASVAVALAAESAEEVPAEPGAACGMYPPEGCPHRSRCSAFSQSRVGLDGIFGKRSTGGVMSLNQSPLMARLAAARQGQQPSPTTSPAAAQAAEQQAPPPARAGGFLARRAAPPPTQAQAPASTPAGGHPGGQIDGYAAGQRCNGRGYYASSNGQGFVDVEPGHSCPACALPDPQRGAGAAVLPPETAHQRESGPADLAAAQAEKKPKRAKKAEAEKSISIKIECETCGERVPADEHAAHAAAHATTVITQPAATPAIPAASIPTDPELIIAELARLGFSDEEIDAMADEAAVGAALSGAKIPASRDARAKIAATATILPTAPDADEVERRLMASTKPAPEKVATAPVPARPVSADAAAKRAAAKAALDEALAERMKNQKRPPEPVSIYVDCHPVKGVDGAVSLDEWMVPVTILAAESATDKNGQPAPVRDWRMVPYVSRGLLATALRECLDTCPAVLVADSRSSGFDVAMEVLTPHAALVVRGVR